ncbi:MAG TPA: AAA family ATPase, partial [Gemmata sp.]|nr:AAA family ATPase [Gemmata sp.]
MPPERNSPPPADDNDYAEDHANRDGDPPDSPPVPSLTRVVHGCDIGFEGIETVDWLWEPYLAFGSLSILDGDPGVGKSLIAADIAARLSTRRDFPDGKKSPLNPTNPRQLVPTIFASAEDSVRKSIIPRIAAAGGTPHTAIFLGGVIEDCRPFALPHDLPLLLVALRKFPGSFFVLDPIMALIDRTVPVGNDQAIRELLTPLARLAAATRSCILMLRHLTPRQSRRSLYRGAGSIGILGTCRTGLVVERHPDDPERRILAMTKTNLGPEAPSLGFRLKLAPEQIIEWPYQAGMKNPETGEELKEPRKFAHLIPPQPVIEWEGVSPLTADDLCQAKTDATGPGLRAAAWLKKVLANGPVAATEIEK